MKLPDSVDDLPSPKVRPLSCDCCPFDLLCEGECIRGNRGPDDDGVGHYAVVGS